LSAYQLSGKPDPAQPIYTLRRILVDSRWTGRQLLDLYRAKTRVNALTCSVEDPIRLPGGTR
jgi:hypothetical protein